MFYLPITSRTLSFQHVNSLKLISEILCTISLMKSMRLRPLPHERRVWCGSGSSSWLCWWGRRRAGCNARVLFLPCPRNSPKKNRAGGTPVPQLYPAPAQSGAAAVGGHS